MYCSLSSSLHASLFLSFTVASIVQLQHPPKRPTIHVSSLREPQQQQQQQQTVLWCGEKLDRSSYCRSSTPRSLASLTYTHTHTLSINTCRHAGRQIPHVRDTVDSVSHSAVTPFIHFQTHTHVHTFVCNQSFNLPKLPHSFVYKHANKPHTHLSIEVRGSSTHGPLRPKLNYMLITHYGAATAQWKHTCVGSLTVLTALWSWTPTAIIDLQATINQQLLRSKLFPYSPIREGNLICDVCVYREIL